MAETIGKNKAKFTMLEIGDAFDEKWRVETNWHFEGVVTDSRQVENGNIFVAIKGERFDGHDFLPTIARIPKVFAIVSREHVGRVPQMPLTFVPDTLLALGDLARFHRRRFAIPLVGITGSYGKTSTRALLDAALNSKFKTLSSKANFNNEIGVPMTLFQLDSTHEAAIIEMGMRGRGQIRYLAKVAEPTIGVITNIGPQHIELLGSLDEIAFAKGELVENLPESGLAVLPFDSPYFEMLCAKAKARIVSFGAREGADYRAEDVRTLPNGEVAFRVSFVDYHKSAREIYKSGGEICIFPEEIHKSERETHNSSKETHISPEDLCISSVQIRLPMPGIHNALNACAAFAVVHQMGVAPDAIAQALRSAELPGARMRVIQAPSGATVVDDCYNAGPDSVRAALQTLLDFPGAGRRVAILGDMKELGEFSETEHRVIGHFAGQFLDLLVGVGGETRPLLNTAIRAASDVEQELEVHWFASASEAKEEVAPMIREGDVVLVKGSRSVGLEAVVEELTK